MRRFALVAAALGLSGVAGAQTGFWVVGLAPGADTGGVYGLSYDGSVAVGASGVGFSAPGVTWTKAGGRNDFGLLPGMPAWTPAYAANDNGSVIAGSMAQDGKTYRAYRWTGSGPPEDLGTLHNWPRSYAEGVSGTGSVIVGASLYTDLQFAFGEAFRWTPGGGMKGLGYLKPNGSYSHAMGVSHDGSAIVGFSQSGGMGNPREAFIWTESQGMKELPGLVGAPPQIVEAHAVNADGTIAVGLADDPGNGESRPVRWIDGVPQNLGVPAGFDYGRAFAVSDDGSVVGGVAGGGNKDPTAVVWTALTGMILLEDFLEGHGVEAPSNLHLSRLEAISGDGLTFAGIARDLTTKLPDGFVATIPSPASVLAFLTPCLLARRRRGTTW